MIEEAGISLELLDGVFYNPYMRINRDLTEALALELDVRSFADVMAASGIRAFRIARHGIETFANDKNEKAYATILWNKHRLGIDVHASMMDAKRFMLEHRVEFLDLDPFGSPAPYLPAAVEARPMILGVTATDTANLCGKHPHAARKLYFVEVRKTPFCHEIGLRILLGFIAREAARNDMIIEPLLSYSWRHHMRVVVRLIKAGTTAIDRMLTHELGRLKFDPQSYKIEVSEGLSGSDIGPIRIGDLGDPMLIERLKAYEFLSKEARKLLEKLPMDSRAPIGYYDLHELARILKASPVSKRKLLRLAEEEGLFLSETHFSPRALKAKDVETIKRLFEKALKESRELF